MQKLNFVANVKQVISWVAGKPVRLTGPAFDVYHPSTGTIYSKCESATAAEVEEVVRVAKIAQKEWAAKTWSERATVLSRTAEFIVTNVEELAKWECFDNGKPLYEARMDVLSCVDTFRFYAGMGHSLGGHHFPLDEARFAYTRREPVGVVGCVGAWNYPIQTCTWKTAPALACGNSVVYKPSPLAPLSATLLAQVLKEAGLPDGVFNVIQGGGETGRALVLDPNVNKVSFTGSIPTGKAIMKDCAERRIKPVTLELGGKSSLVVLEDADVVSAVAGAMAANFYSQGQVCSNASKVLVHKSIFNEFKEKLVADTKKMKVGDPMDENTRVGAHISAQHRDNVKAHIDNAVKEGAKVLCGGEKVVVSGLEGGYYLSPCILENITHSMNIYKEEVFGSVLLLIPFETEEQALHIANDTEMGLAAGVFTRDLKKAHTFASKLHAGNVYVNSFNDVSPLVPFGGVGESGFGRENGVAALEHYTHIKSVFVNLDKMTNPFE